MKAFRYFFLPLIVGSLLLSPAAALTKSISATPMTLITTLPNDIAPVGALVRGSVIYLFGGGSGTANLNGMARAIDVNGATLWSLDLDSGRDEIVTAATMDKVGHLWLVATSAPTIANPTPTPTTTPSATPAGVLNPDSVVMDPSTPLRQDLTTLILWEVDSAGKILSTYSVDLARSFIARSILASSDGISIAGIVATTSGSAGFFLTADLAGTFDELVIIGKSETEINAISRIGTNYLLAGSSADKILAKPLIGSRDGILLTISPIGKILAVVRSANVTSSRSWKSATPSLLFAGDAIANGVSEAVVTKFSAKLAPTWTARFPSSGTALAIDAPIFRYAVFASNSAIAGIKPWKPSKPAVIALGMDSKGVVQVALSAKSMAAPIALGYSTQLGIVILGRTGQNTVSLFHALTR